MWSCEQVRCEEAHSSEPPVCLAPGTEFIDKLTNGFALFGSAFANPLPSFHPVDLLIGLIAGALLKLAVYVKGKNRKKFRQGEEYGSARWSA